MSWLGLLWPLDVAISRVSTAKPAEALTGGVLGGAVGAGRLGPGLTVPPFAGRTAVSKFPDS